MNAVVGMVGCTDIQRTTPTFVQSDRAGVSVSLYSQFRELTAIRAGDAFWGDMSVQIGRGVLRRADRARRAFYRRASNGETPGYPRFKSSRR